MERFGRMIFLQTRGGGRESLNPRRLGLGPARTFFKFQKFSEIFLKKISITDLHLLSDEDPPPSFSQRDLYKILKMKSWNLTISPKKGLIPVYSELLLEGGYEVTVFGYFLPLHSTLGTRKKLTII